MKREMGATLIVDEAHSLGTRGKNGRGVCEDAGVESEVDFVVGTFSKSLGAIGGFAVSDLPDFDLLRIVCRPYMFTASLPPAVVGSVTAALARISTDESLGARVRSNSSRLYSRTGAGGLRGRAGAQCDCGAEDAGQGGGSAVLEPAARPGRLRQPGIAAGDAGEFVAHSLQRQRSAYGSSDRSSALSIMVAVGRELGILDAEPKKTPAQVAERVSA